MYLYISLPFFFSFFFFFPLVYLRVRSIDPQKLPFFLIFFFFSFFIIKINYRSAALARIAVLEAELVSAKQYIASLKDDDSSNESDSENDSESENESKSNESKSDDESD